MTTNRKNIYYNKFLENYTITKCFDGKAVSFGSYKKLSDAVKVRDKVIEAGWDKKQLPRIRRELGMPLQRKIKL